MRKQKNNYNVQKKVFDTLYNFTKDLIKLINFGEQYMFLNFLSDNRKDKF